MSGYKQMRRQHKRQLYQVGDDDGYDTDQGSLLVKEHFDNFIINVSNFLLVFCFYLLHRRTNPRPIFLPQLENKQSTELDELKQKYDKEKELKVAQNARELELDLQRHTKEKEKAHVSL